MCKSAQLPSALSPRSKPKRAGTRKFGSCTRSTGLPAGWSSCNSQVPPQSRSGRPEYRVRSVLKAVRSGSDAVATDDPSTPHCRCRRDGWHTLVPLRRIIESCCSRPVHSGAIIPKHGATAADVREWRTHKWEHAPHHHLATAVSAVAKSDSPRPARASVSAAGPSPGQVYSLYVSHRP